MLGARSHPPWRGVALLVASAFFMENLDGTIVATAAPRMASSLGVRAVDLNSQCATCGERFIRWSNCRRFESRRFE
ncbi:MAG TPA: hypothetical protein VIJ96_13050 [Acidothermaceae bacterium]